MKILLPILLSAAAIAGCKVYSFTGRSIPENIKTVKVEFFRNNSTDGPASYSQTFTEALKDKFTSESSLTLITGNADVTFRGEITGYAYSAQSPTAQETSALSRLTITVKVEYENRHDESLNWSKSFNRYAEYESTIDLNTIESELVSEINDQLTDDIFNRAFGNW